MWGSWKESILEWRLWSPLAGARRRAKSEARSNTFSQSLSLILKLRGEEREVERAKDLFKQFKESKAAFATSVTKTLRSCLCRIRRELLSGREGNRKRGRGKTEVSRRGAALIAPPRQPDGQRGKSFGQRTQSRSLLVRRHGHGRRAHACSGTAGSHHHRAWAELGPRRAGRLPQCGRPSPGLGDPTSGSQR